jgi:hypothetical protein
MGALSWLEVINTRIVSVASPLESPGRAIYRDDVSRPVIKVLQVGGCYRELNYLRCYWITLDDVSLIFDQFGHRVKSSTLLDFRTIDGDLANPGGRAKLSLGHPEL